MVDITLNNIGKKYKREWIFRGIDLEIKSGEHLVILGGNGSGKSTLLQVISGFVNPNEGKIHYKKDGTELLPERVKDQLAFASPYLTLPEDLTALELIEHLSHFRTFLNAMSVHALLDLIQLKEAGNKYIKHYSSGMKQRLKLGLAILSESPVLMLDEPLSNLDKAGTEWYRRMIQEHGKSKSIIVCSNAIEQEHFFCQRSINVTVYK